MEAHDLIDSHRKSWNKRQKQLRKMLHAAEPEQEAIKLFLHQHRVLHSAALAGDGEWSFEDTVFSGMSNSQLRRVPPRGEHSIAWLIWHIARIEDVTMNMLVAGSEQVYTRAGWIVRLGIPFRHTGNLMPAGDVVELSAAIDFNALRAYRLEVGLRTLEIVTELQAGQLQSSIARERLQQVLDVGAVVPAAQALIDYWSRRTLAGLLLMPATRHNFVHLYEALRVKMKLTRLSKPGD